MPFLPEWAPNLHPLIVHFPIALLIFALVFDLFALIFKNANWLRYTAGSLYILGALAALVTFFTGKQAADVVNVPATANPTLNEHADWAYYTVWFFGIYGLIRLLFLSKKLSRKLVVSFVTFLIGAGGMFLLFETAEHGAELVFRYGVGVKAAEKVQQELTESQVQEEMAADSRIVMQEDGSWEWKIGHNADTVLEQQFNWLIGKPETLNAKTVHDEANGDVLALDPQNTTVLITAASPLKGVQVDVRINLDQFQGKFMVVHHLQDSLTYDFAMIENGTVKLGRMTAGKETIEEQGNYEANGWLTFRAVAEGRHFHGYMNDTLIAHGHADALPAGWVGFFIQGNGKVLLEYINVQSLR